VSLDALNEQMSEGRGKAGPSISVCGAWQDRIDARAAGLAAAGVAVLRRAPFIVVIVVAAATAAVVRAVT